MSFSSSRKVLIAYNQNYYVLMEEKRDSFKIAPSASNYLNVINNVDKIKLIDQSQSFDNLNMKAFPQDNPIHLSENKQKSKIFSFH
jgi:hypothetical protein